MTAVIFNVQPNEVVVTCDTLAMCGDPPAPCFFTSKFYPLPHLFGAMFATGIGDFATQWFVHLDRFLARDIHHLNDFVTPALKGLWKSLNIPDGKTTTIYHVGFSEAENRYVAFAYRSTSGFTSERLSYGFYTKPPVPNAVVNVFPDDFIKIMERQRADDMAQPYNQRVFIGGEVQALMLFDKTTTIRTIHRFNDYDLTYERMCDMLIANKRPSGKDAP